MTLLSVNVNAVAYLRNRRDVGWPNVIDIARIVLDAGAAGITVHPRPDERHIRRTDVYELAELLVADYPDKELNVEGYPTPDFLSLVADIKPHQVTLVPDDPSQSTSDHGWDFAANSTMLTTTIAALKNDGARTALFVDAEPTAAHSARLTGADRIEIYTGPYGGATTQAAITTELDRIAATAEGATNADPAGLLINAGHDLTAENLPALVARVPQIAEVSIGHGITADALKIGFAAATKLYIDALKPR